MVTIINGYRGPSPLAQGIERAAKAIFGDTLTPALKRAQLERTNQSIELAGQEQVAKEDYARSLGGPLSQALLGGVSAADAGGYNRLGVANTLLNEGADLIGDRRMTAAQLGAGQSAGSTGLGFREGEANQTARSKYSADASAGATISSARIRAQQAAEAAAADLAERIRQFDQTPQEAMVGGAPAFVPRSGAFAPGVAPILSETDTKGMLLGNNFGNLDTLGPRQANVVGALPSETDVKGDFLSRALVGVDPTSVPEDNILAGIGLGAPKAPALPEVLRLQDPRGVSYMSVDGGRTDVNTGQPIPADAREMGKINAASLADAGLQPTNTNATEVYRQMANLDDFSSTLSAARKIAVSDPTLFGAAGMARRFGQGVTNFARSVDSVFGGEAGFEEAIRGAQADLETQDPHVRQLFAGLYDPNLDKIGKYRILLTYQGTKALAGEERISDNDYRNMVNVFGADNLFSSQESFLSALDVADEQVAARRASLDRRSQGDYSRPQAAPAPEGTYAVTDQASYDAVPPGALYVTPTGETRQKQ